MHSGRQRSGSLLGTGILAEVAAHGIAKKGTPNREVYVAHLAADKGGRHGAAASQRHRSCRQVILPQDVAARIHSPTGVCSVRQWRHGPMRVAAPGPPAGRRFRSPASPCGVPPSFRTPARLASPVRDPPRSAAAEGRQWFSLPGRADHRHPGADAGFAGVDARVSGSWEGGRRQAADADSPRRGRRTRMDLSFSPSPLQAAADRGNPDARKRLDALRK